MSRTFFEQSLGMERAEAIAVSLEAQVEGYGLLDVPLLSRELRPYLGGTGVDVGTGNGNFLFKIAQSNPNIQFIGLEHDAALLDMARSQLSDLRLTNVELRQTFFDENYTDTHDVIFTRFTLQHSSSPQDFVGSVYRSLKPGGMFVAIEPIYDYYDSEPPDPVWQEFLTRMTENYKRWGSNQNVPKVAPRWFADAGFERVRASINMYSPVTIGLERLEAAILTTIAALSFDYPDVWDEPFKRRIAEWFKNPPVDPYVSIAHLVGFKPENVA